MEHLSWHSPPPTTAHVALVVYLYLQQSTIYKNNINTLANVARSHIVQTNGYASVVVSYCCCYRSFTGFPPIIRQLPQLLQVIVNLCVRHILKQNPIMIDFMPSRALFLSNPRSFPIHTLNPFYIQPTFAGHLACLDSFLIIFPLSCLKAFQLEQILPYLTYIVEAKVAFIYLS